MLGALDDPRALLWALDLFAMPSINEGLGVAVLEAMACGVPVIASAVGGMPEIVVDQITGKLTPPGDTAALARELVALSSASELRATMGSAARARVVARFSMEAMARGTLNVYCEALAER
jgi:glycosyltransferase involved in cell wall biosynthesis